MSVEENAFLTYYSAIHPEVLKEGVETTSELIKVIKKVDKNKFLETYKLVNKIKS